MYYCKAIGIYKFKAIHVGNNQCTVNLHTKTYRLFNNMKVSYGCYITCSFANSCNLCRLISNI